MKVLNLYSGLGGNRKNWDNCEVTAIENNESIAKFYSDKYPGDELIICDAHEYLLNNYYKYDFIWSSINCPTHSRARFWSSKPNNKVKPVYPDMKLYEEILFLYHYFEGKFIVENVVPFYKPLIDPTIKIGRHLFWSNFNILKRDFEEADVNRGNIDEYQKLHGIDISKYKFTTRRDKILRNCVHPDLGLHIFNEMKRSTTIKNKQMELLFDK